MDKIIIPIKGMHCASCAINIEKSLKKVKGVKNAIVNLLTEKAYIDGDQVIRKELILAVAKAGYQSE